MTRVNGGWDRTHEDSFEIEWGYGKVIAGTEDSGGVPHVQQENSQREI